jgi:phage baseplate assembly protein W
MPIIKGIKRISPLDLNKNVTIGVAFPLDEQNMFKGTETVRDQSKANLINLLLTNPGERIFLPKYGIGVKSLLFEQQIDLDLLKERIKTQTNRYISGINIQDVKSGLSEDEHTLFLTIVYKSLLDGSLDSIQLNFR